VGHPNLFSRRPHVQTDFEIQPMRTRVQAPIRPSLPPIEFADQGEPAVIRGVELPGQFRDLRFQFGQ